MKKIIPVILICLCLCGCGNKEKSILTCSKSEWSNEKTTNDEFVSYYSSDNKLEKICSTRKMFFASQEQAQKYYDVTTKADVYVGTDSGCKIDDKIVTCSSCNTKTSGFGSNRGTFEKDKKHFEDEGYECKKGTNE